MTLPSREEVEQEKYKFLGDIPLRTKAAELASEVWYPGDKKTYLEMVDEIFHYLRYGKLPK
jgi:hypothetical protein